MKNIFIKLILFLEMFEQLDDQTQIKQLEKFKKIPGVDVVIEKNGGDSIVKRLS